MTFLIFCATIVARVLGLAIPLFHWTEVSPLTLERRKTVIGIIVIASALIVMAGLLLLVMPKMAPATATPAAAPTGTTTPPTASATATAGNTAAATTPETNRAHDELMDPMERFGLVDDSPNMYRAVVSGPSGKGRILRIISDLDARSGNPLVVLIERLSGKRYYGLPFVTSIRPIDIDRVVRKQTQTTEAESSLISQLDATGIVRRRGLMRQFPRPIYHPAIDTLDGVRINLNSYLVIEVIGPRPEAPFTIYKDSLLQTIDQIVGSHVATKINQMKLEDYKASNSGAVNRFDLGELNRKLRILDVRALQHNVSDYEIVKNSPEVQRAMEEVVIAEQQAKAKRTAGKGEADYTIRTGAAKARVVERMAKAEAVRFDELFKSFRVKGVSEAQAIKMAQAVIVAEVNAEAIGKLVYYGAGSSGVQLAVPGVGEKKK